MSRTSLFPTLTLTALTALLAACGNGGTPAPLVSACDLPQYPQRAVQLDTTIGVERDGRVVLIDSKCPAIHVALQLTGQASAVDLAARLKAAGGPNTDAAAMRVGAKMTGVYSAAPAQFTAESLALQAPAQP